MMKMEVGMKVYLDLVFILNFCYDFLLLLSVTIETKTYPKIKMLISGGLVGSLTLSLLFLPLNNFSLLLTKILTSILMILVSFGRKNILRYLKSFYGNSVILGGILYALDLSFNNSKNTTIFLLLIIIAPLILFLYLKGRRIDIIKQNYLHNISFKYQDKTYNLVAFLDTGNKVQDPYKKRNVIVAFLDDLDIADIDTIYVPYETLSGKGILPCIKIEELRVDDKTIDSSKYLIGKSKEKINLYGASCIIPEILKEE